ncbi:MAG: hypothetical protein ACI3VN_00285 [Candidatus Onthomonas sp.]
MKKVVKIIGAAGAVALAAGLVPYHFKSDKESGEFELGGLLWNLKKTSGEAEDTYTMELLPFMDKEEEAQQETAEAEVEVEAEAPAGQEEPEEPFAEEVSNDVVVEEVDTKEETAAEAAPAENQEPQEEEESAPAVEDAQ